MSTDLDSSVHLFGNKQQTLRYMGKIADNIEA